MELEYLKEKCISLCKQCEEVCKSCATNHGGNQAMDKCIRLCLDCIQECEHLITNSHVKSGADLSLYEKCADACNLCAAECGMHDNEICRKCAEICIQCEAECRNIASLAPQI